MLVAVWPLRFAEAQRSGEQNRISDRVASSRAGSELFDDLTTLDLKFLIRDRAPAMKFLELV